MTLHEKETWTLKFLTEITVRNLLLLWLIFVVVGYIGQTHNYLPSKCPYELIYYIK